MARQALALAALAVTPSASADVDEEASACLQAKTAEAAGDGWQLRAKRTLHLEAAASQSFQVSLYASTRYRIVGCAPTDRAQLGISVKNADGAPVNTAPAIGREPTVTFSPTQTGLYSIDITAGSSPIQAGFALMFK